MEEIKGKNSRKGSVERPKKKLKRSQKHEQGKFKNGYITLKNTYHVEESSERVGDLTEQEQRDFEILLDKCNILELNNRDEVNTDILCN